MELAVLSETGDSDVRVTRLIGEVDLHSAAELSTKLNDVIANDPKVVLDLDEVGFLDSTGLGALVAARTNATDRGGDLVLVCTQQRLLKLFAITGLQSVFQFHEDVASAVNAFTA
ncbi:MAG TPA: STAS domain-containing protein [Jatrophihabitans sp.]|jgi:anti-sigma B factor antagonist